MTVVFSSYIWSCSLQTAQRFCRHISPAVCTGKKGKGWTDGNILLCGLKINLVPKGNYYHLKCRAFYYFYYKLYTSSSTTSDNYIVLKTAAFLNLEILGFLNYYYLLIITLQINLKNNNTEQIAVLSVDFSIQGLSKVKACQLTFSLHPSKSNARA